MDGLFFFVVMAVGIPAAKPATSDVPLNFYFVEWRAAVKGRFCPGVASFCPVVSWFLSQSGPDFVPMWPELRLALCEPVRKLTADFRMKIDDDSGAVEPVIAQMQCTHSRPRARARWGHNLRFGERRSSSICSRIETELS